MQCLNNENLTLLYFVDGYITSSHIEKSNTQNCRLPKMYRKISGYTEIGKYNILHDIF